MKKETPLDRFVNVVVWLIFLIMILVIPHLLIVYLGTVLVPISIVALILVPIAVYIFDGDGGKVGMSIFITLGIILCIPILGIIVWEFMMFILELIRVSLIEFGWISKYKG